MTPIDDLFREGLGDRKPDVPQDLWAKIAAKKAAVPEGEALDHLFADKLAQRQAPVPTGMWARIVAARQPVAYRSYAALLLLFLLGGLAYFLWPGTQVQGTAEAAAFPAGPEQDMADQGGLREESVTSLPHPPDQPARTRTAAPPLTANSGERKESAGVPAIPLPTNTLTSKRPRPRALAAIASLPIPVPATAAEAPGAGVSPSPAVPFHPTRRRFEAELLLGPAYAHQTFGTASEGDRSLRDAREVSEYPEASFQLSARLRYRLTDRFRILTGLTYVAIRNQFEYETVGALQRAVLQRTTNRLQLLEVPLLASYELPGRRLRLNVNAGPVINLATRVRGKYIHPNFAQPQALEDDSDYRSNIGVGWMASLTTTYFLGKAGTTQLLLEPFFKHYPGSFTRSGAPLAEHYWMAGLQLGLRKQLR